MQSWVSQIYFFQELANPGLASWAIFSRPSGTGRNAQHNPALRAGLLSAVPPGLNPEPAGSHEILKPTLHNVLTHPKETGLRTQGTVMAWLPGSAAMGPAHQVCVHR
jgi:hypothetical protein